MRNLKLRALILGLFFYTGFVQAQEETSVLPHGIFRTWVIGAVGGTSQSFSHNGNRQSLAHVLNRSVTVNDLAKSLETNTPDSAKELRRLKSELDSFGRGLGIDSLGNSLYQADFYAEASIEAKQLVYALEYGLTEKISLGLGLPMLWYDISSQFRIETQNSFAPSLEITKGTPLEDGIRKFAQQAPDAETFKNSLFTEKGYEIPSSTNIFGIGDLEAGLKFRSVESSFIDVSNMFTIRFPTASHQKSFSNILDQSTGDKQFDLSFSTNVDYKVHPRLTLLSGAKYTHQFADSQSIVAPLIGSDDPLPNLNDPRVYDPNARRKLGNMWDLNFNARYTLFNKRLTLIAAYLMQFKQEDQYSGSNAAISYSALEDGTKSQSKALEFFVVYSTVQDYFRKEKAVPWEFSLTYHHALGGINSPAMNYAYGRVKFFFN